MGGGGAALIPIRVMPTMVQTSETGTIAQVTVSVMTAPSQNVTIDLMANNDEVLLSTMTITLTPTQFSHTFNIIGQDDTMADGNQAFTVALSPAVSADPNYNGSDPPDVMGVNLDDETCDITMGQYCGTQGCCVNDPNVSPVGACGACGVGPSTQIRVRCLSTSECSGALQCAVFGGASTCEIVASPSQPPFPRVHCTTSAECNGLSCLPDPQLPQMSTCQCSPTAQQCASPTPFCDPVNRWCFGGAVTENWSGGVCVMGGMPACFDGTGCCQRTSGFSCQNPGMCSGGVHVGCRSTDNCMAGEYCSYDRVTDGGLPTKARCVPGLDGHEACSMLGGARNCAGGGTCTGTWNQGAIQGELPRYCVGSSGS